VEVVCWIINPMEQGRYLLVAFLKKQEMVLDIYDEDHV
jgi:hypothetical protein